MSKEIPKIYMTGVKKNKVPKNTGMPSFDEALKDEIGIEEKLPSKVDLRNKFPEVYSQTLGCCTTCAALACDDYYYHNTKKWKPSLVFTYHMQKVVDKEPMIDDGSTVWTALRAIKKYGVCNAKVWPEDEPLEKNPSKAALADGLKGHEIKKNYEIEKLSQVKKALYRGYPVPCSFTWTDAMMNVGSDYILPEPTEREVDKCDTGHAVCVVGYDNKKELLIIRNSWGSDWGDNGYCYMTYDTFKLCMFEAYAVTK